MEANELLSFLNRSNLEPPLLLSLETVSVDSGVIIMRLAKLLDDITITLEKQSQFQVEAAMLSRMIYRMKRKFLKDKGFKALQKINKCLCHFLELDIPGVMTSLRRSIFDRNGPSKEMLQWALVHLLTFGALFLRVYNTCIESARFMIMKIKDGHFWDVALICIGVVSRIWAISLYFIKRLCHWYKNLKAYTPILKSSECTWLPEKVVLPEEMESWLGYPPFLKEIEIKVSVEDNNHSTEIVNKEENQARGSFEGSYLNEDLGESLSAEECLRRRDPIDEIISIKTLLQFVTKEKRSRKQCVESSLTRKLNSVEWKEFEEYIYSNLTQLRKIPQYVKFKSALKEIKFNIKKRITK